MITPTVAVILLIIILVVFGPGKLPGVGKAVGKTISNFKREINTVDAEIVSEEKTKTTGEDEAKQEG
ncbi:MAG: twin-arginine translocase TatA/TatE family subunit [Desulfitobacterium sp.]|nr:twin-arginine translocase TatA/TatE family subunit [Desulfitobacterium sp.]